MWTPWWSSAGSSRSLPGPPWWTRCRGWIPPGSSWSAGPARPAGWSQPELSSVRSGKPHGLHAVPGSPPESCTSLGLLDPPPRSQTSCWKPTPSWQMSETGLQPGVEKIRSLKQVQFTGSTLDFNYIQALNVGSRISGIFGGMDKNIQRPSIKEWPLYLSKVLLSLQKLLLASSWVGKQLVPALHQGSVTSLDGFWLDMLGGQQLVL